MVVTVTPLTTVVKTTKVPLKVVSVCSLTFVDDSMLLRMEEDMDGVEITVELCNVSIIEDKEEEPRIVEFPYIGLTITDEE